jgi:hypothetical protein
MFFLDVGETFVSFTSIRLRGLLGKKPRPPRVAVRHRPRVCGIFVFFFESRTIYNRLSRLYTFKQIKEPSRWTGLPGNTNKGTLPRGRTSARATDQAKQSACEGKGVRDEFHIVNRS